MIVLWKMLLFLAAVDPMIPTTNEIVKFIYAEGGSYGRKSIPVCTHTSLVMVILSDIMTGY